MKTIEKTTTYELLSEVTRLGVRLWREGDRLRYAPKGKLTRALLEQLRESKGEILSLLPDWEQNPESITIKPVSRHKDLPVSFAQERLLSLARLEPESSVYNIPAAFRLKGLLSVAALEESLNKILRRHEILRTTFAAVDGQPVQVISPDATFKLSVINLEGVPETEREQQAERLISEEAQKPFDLAKGPLLRVKLLRLAEREHLLLVTVHHIIFDGWSLSVFLLELDQLYKASLGSDASQPSPLPPLPIQYADFASWQRQQLSGEGSELAYWKNQLGGSASALQLPATGWQSSAGAYQGASKSLVLSQELTNSLKKLSRDWGFSLYTTLLAAFGTLLYRYTGQEDIIVCSPVACRDRLETEGLIGYFNNIVAMRTDLSGNPSFRELVGRVRTVASGAYNHSNLPFQEVANLPNLRRIPLSRAMFAFYNTPTHTLELPGITASELPVHNGTANFDLSASIEEKGEELICVLDYKTNLFDAEAIAKFLDNFQTLLASIALNPEQHLNSLPCFRETETEKPASLMPDPDKSLFVPPRDELELKLAKIWEKVLGIEPIGVKDNFFELGGHSLLAVTLFERVENAFNQKIPLSTLIEAPTIEQLASLLSQEKWSGTWSPLVPIQPNGSKPPLFCVHALGGNVLSYQKLASHLASDRPIYGLQSQGLDKKQAPLTRIEDMAALYIKEMQMLQNDGPYFLAGHSFGGLVAFEMARQLYNQSHKVAIVAIFDTVSPAFVHNPPSLLNFMHTHLSNLWRVEPQEKLTYIMERVKWHAKWKRQIENKIGGESENYYANTLPSEVKKSILNVLEANFMATRNYVPPAYPGVVTLFRCREQSPKTSHSRDLGWGKLAVGGVEIQDVPGAHEGIMVEPNVRVVAEKLRNCLDRAQAEIEDVDRP